MKNNNNARTAYTNTIRRRAYGYRRAARRNRAIAVLAIIAGFAVIAAVTPHIVADNVAFAFAAVVAMVFVPIACGYWGVADTNAARARETFDILARIERH